MTFLYFMVLLVSGVNAETTCNSSNGLDKPEKLFLYNSTEIKIIQTFRTVLCNWETSQCYVECTSVNHTMNITNVFNVTSVTEKLITNQSKTIVIKLCEQNITCNVTNCTLNEIRPLIEKSSNSTNLRDLKRATQIKSMCSKLFAEEKEIKKVYIKAEKKYIDALINLPFNGKTIDYELEQFSITIVKMDMMNTTDLGRVKISAPKVPDGDQHLDVFIPTAPFVNVSENQCKVGIVMYTSAQMFIDESTVLKSSVIRVETVGRQLKDLSNHLVINFTVNNNDIIPLKRSLKCQFYDVDAVPGLEWNDGGSFTNLEYFNSSNTVTCSYNHMTPFAVLLVDMKQIDPQQWKILSYLTYIGCSLSSFFSAVTIFLYVFMKSSYKDNSIRIHVSLSVAVFLLNTSFLFIEWGASFSQENVCVLIAVLIQYSLLACFSWMTIEALHLYLLLIKVFNTYIKHYLLKLSLFGWGMPAVLVGGSLCVFGSTPFYGRKELNLSDTNGTTHFCWITNTQFLYGMNISYFSLTFLFNTCVLAVVTHQIFKMRRLNKGSRLPSSKDISTVLGLTFLLGMTWGLIFLSSGYTNYPILYLFCICNSLQGLFLFLWFCGTVKKNRPLKQEGSTVTKSAGASENIYESSFTD